MSDVQIAIVIAGMTVVTLLTRDLLMMTGRYWTPSHSRLSSLRYAPAAGLAALVIPDMSAALLEVTTEPLVAQDGWVRLLAVAAIILTYHFSRRSGVALLAGAIVYLVGKP